jgi:predicted amidophosphoribosyltransferase
MEIIVMLLFGLPVVFWGLSLASYRACKQCKNKMRRDAKVCASCGADKAGRWPEPSQPAGRPTPPPGGWRKAPRY